MFKFINIKMTNLSESYGYVYYRDTVTDDSSSRK